MVIVLILSYLFVLIDQISKMLVFNFAPNGTDIIPHFFKFSLTFNTGAAFSAFGDSTVLLAVVSMIAVCVIMYFVLKIDSFKKQKLYSISLALILGGTFGNLIDRTLTVTGLLDGVVDFVDMYLFGWHFPGTFNLADAFLSIGMVLLIIDILFLSDKRKNNREVKGVERTREKS